MTGAAQPDTASLRRQLRVMLVSSWLVAIAVVGLGAAAYLWANLQPDVYQGQGVVRVFNATTPGLPGAAGAARVDPAREVQTQASYMTSDTVRLGVIQRLGPRADAIDAVRVAGVPNSDLLRVRVESRSPSIAQEAAQAYADVYVEARRASITATLVARADELRGQATKIQEEITSLDGRITQLVPPPEISFGRAVILPDSEEVRGLRSRRAGLADQLAATNNLAQELNLEASIRQSSLEVVDPAERPRSPVRPVPLRDGAIGGLLGLFIGVAVAMLRERTSDRLRSVGEVEEAVRPLTTLALVPLDRALGGSGRRRRKEGSGPSPVAASDPGAPASESYRTLRAALLFSGADKAARTLLVTSSVTGEGKTTTAANLAVTMARSGSHVLLLDADLKRPTVHERFDLSNGKGLTSVFRREAPLSQVLQPIEIPGPGSLDVLVAGPDGWDATDLLASGLAAPLFEQLERSYEYVVVDSAPVLSGADPLALAHLANGILLVTRVGRIGRRDLQMAKQRLEQVSGLVLGVVINAVSPSHAGYYHYYDYQRPGGRRPPSKPSKPSKAAVPTPRPEVTVPVRAAPSTPVAAPKPAPVVAPKPAPVVAAELVVAVQEADDAPAPGPAPSPPAAAPPPGAGPEVARSGGRTPPGSVEQTILRALGMGGMASTTGRRSWPRTPRTSRRDRRRTMP